MFGTENLMSSLCACDCLCVTYFPLSHLMVGGGSPTALQGKTMSFIQGVVTVPLKVRILAGAESNKKKQKPLKNIRMYDRHHLIISNVLLLIL